MIRFPQAVALTIAGSDPSGGAGLQADLKTFQQFGVYGMSVVTLITVQNTLQVGRVEVLSHDLVIAQLDSVLADIAPKAIKIGALGNVALVERVAERLQSVTCPIVVDPVLVSKHGHSLVDGDVIDAYKKYLLPRAWLVTPNRFEAERLTGLPLCKPEQAAAALHCLVDLGAKHALIKVGEFGGQSHHALSIAGGYSEVQVPRLAASNTHGSGCVLAAAIVAKLAMGESDPYQVAMFGIRRTLAAIHCNTQLGHGIHPAETRAM